MSTISVWSFCLNPDWENRQLGLFIPNPFLGHSQRFWHNNLSGNTRSPSRPPSPRQNGARPPAVPDQVAFGIREDTPYTVENIMVDCSPRGNGGAGQASPFRNGAGSLICTLSRAPDATGVAINGDDYSLIGPERVFADPTFPSGDSRYELTIVAVLRDRTTGDLFEFSYDPEMDVNNDQ
jgi:hypothetical protein